MIRAGLPLVLSLAALPAAGEISFGLPLDCQLGETCFIQQYVDRDPGPGVADFACGAASYDGHKGTDFALPSVSAMAAGVTVRAAAPGTVKAVRDGMADTPGGHGGADLEGRDCGNGVVIDHSQGWESQYCHLAGGSVAVAKGAPVTEGMALGRVGMSGRTEFPHLHITFRKDGAVIDPFRPESTSCGPPDGALWSGEIGYDPGGMIAAGFAPAIPDYGAIKAGTAAEDIARDAPALVLWAYFYRGQAGDVVTLRIDGPDGPFHRQAVAVDRTQSQAFRASGKRLRAPLTPGVYSGTAVLERGGRELDRITVTTTVP
ncbi:M23 family metallopeptidase [Anianabacter salinae]|uniref:M23 family metallopeptidase n=1 Tax=Anianabacter salinae TaxID=2851023 RepID=UPI00225DDE29|nr:M23 family metallopeptidase [Anianabacter salinae]MBV0912608.1 M23 family metallopeptidase [Anianabacter salinae]